MHIALRLCLASHTPRSATLPHSQGALMPTNIAWDVFLCHSSADKEAVRALAQALKGQGKRVWFDEEQVHHGDSTSDKVNEGLARSRWM